MELQDWVREHKMATGLFGIGSVLLGIGSTQLISSQKATEIVITNPAAESQVSQVVVDVAGAVEKPGVYRLSQGSRVADALIAAGGLAAGADRGFIARYVNQAEILKDATKLFIPNEGEVPKTDETNSVLINVNRASLGELTELKGIGEQRARAIIANRPYTSLDELTAKAKIPASVVEENKSTLTVY